MIASDALVNIDAQFAVFLEANITGTFVRSNCVAAGAVFGTVVCIDITFIDVDTD
jgi:hypothetical protein